MSDEKDEKKLKGNEMREKIGRNMAKRPSGGHVSDWFYNDDDVFGQMPFSFGSAFRDFDEHFRRTRQEMNRLMQMAQSGELKSPEEGGPYVYGMSVKVGPDGVPQVQEFGNVKGPYYQLGNTETAQQLEGYREPLVDVIEDRDVISITVEMPGVERDEIDLEISEEEVTLKVDHEKRRYFKKIPLGVQIVPDSSKATFRNGVLEVVVKKTEEKKGKKVKVE